MSTFIYTHFVFIFKRVDTAIKLTAHMAYTSLLMQGDQVIAQVHNAYINCVRRKYALKVLIFFESNHALKSPQGSLTCIPYMFACVLYLILRGY